MRRAGRAGEGHRRARSIHTTSTARACCTAGSSIAPSTRARRLHRSDRRAEGAWREGGDGGDEAGQGGDVPGRRDRRRRGRDRGAGARRAAADQGRVRGAAAHRHRGAWRCGRRAEVFKDGNIAEGDAAGRPAISMRASRPAAHIDRGDATDAGQTHVCLETHGCVCEWDGDKLTAWASTQAVHGTREGFAQALGDPAAERARDHRVHGRRLRLQVRRRRPGHHLRASWPSRRARR